LVAVVHEYSVRFGAKGATIMKKTDTGEEETGYVWSANTLRHIESGAMLPLVSRQH